MKRKTQQLSTTRRVVAYTRVSTDKQAENGVSMAAQKEKLCQYAALYDLSIVAFVEDAGASAKTLQRPGLQQALSLLRNGQADALLVTKLDRLTRSVKDLGMLIDEYFADSHYALLSVGDNIDTGSAAGRLVLNVLASVSQWEREAIAERTSAALAHKRQQGQKTGGDVPYGYRVAEDGKTLIENMGEQALITAITEARQRGLSQRVIVNELARQGFTTRKGTAIRLIQVQRLMAAHSIV